jgi:hypothetical protein
MGSYGTPDTFSPTFIRTFTADLAGPDADNADSPLARRAYGIADMLKAICKADDRIITEMDRISARLAFARAQLAAGYTTGTEVISRQSNDMEAAITIRELAWSTLYALLTVEELATVCAAAVYPKIS